MVRGTRIFPWLLLVIKLQNNLSPRLAFFGKRSHVLNQLPLAWANWQTFRRDSYGPVLSKLHFKYAKPLYVWINIWHYILQFNSTTVWYCMSLFQVCMIASAFPVFQRSDMSESFNQVTKFERHMGGSRFGRMWRWSCFRLGKTL